MAPRGGGGARHSRGNKPHAHKRCRRRGDNSRGSVSRKINADISVGPNRNNSQSNLPRQTASNGNINTVVKAKQGNGVSVSELRPIKVSSSGIMVSLQNVFVSPFPLSYLSPQSIACHLSLKSTWKKPLGGLIRYYVHTRTNDRTSPVDQRTAEEEVDKFYFRSGCCMEGTKTTILKALGVSVIQEKGWISMSMAIEKIDNKQVSGYKSTENLIDVSKIDGGVSGYTETVNGKGIKLQQVLRAGEGPAHCHEQWTTIVVPKWAVGKSYFFEVKNDSPLNLSCELFLDGKKVAFNSPLPSNSRRMIRPDVIRYFARHQWILDNAKRVKFITSHNETPSHDNIIQPTTPRYNGIRPDYAGQRVCSALYPNPSTFGWRFTGSVQESRVEFFEKNMNIGGFVKLDFYYSTGTIKTVVSVCVCVCVRVRE